MFTFLLKRNSLKKILFSRIQDKVLPNRIFRVKDVRKSKHKPLPFECRMAELCTPSFLPNDACDIKYYSCYSKPSSHSFVSQWSGHYFCSCSVFNYSGSHAGTVTIPDPIFTSRTTDILLVMDMATMLFGEDGAVMARLCQMAFEQQALHQVSMFEYYICNIYNSYNHTYIAYSPPSNISLVIIYFVQISRQSPRCSAPAPPPRLSSGGRSPGPWSLGT